MRPCSFSMHTHSLNSNFTKIDKACYTLGKPKKEDGEFVLSMMDRKGKIIMGTEKKIYLLEVWNLSTNEWGDRTKNQRVLMHLVTITNENDDYKRSALTKIVKDMSGDNANKNDYEISCWVDDEVGSMFLMSDWGSARDKGNQWYGVEAVLTKMEKSYEI